MVKIQTEQTSQHLLPVFTVYKMTAQFINTLLTTKNRFSESKVIEMQLFLFIKPHHFFYLDISYSISDLREKKLLILFLVLGTVSNICAK